MVAGTCVADDAYLIQTCDISYFVATSHDDAGGLFKRDIEIKNAPCRANRGLAQTLYIYIYNKYFWIYWQYNALIETVIVKIRIVLNATSPTSKLIIGREKIG